MPSNRILAAAKSLRWKHGKVCWHFRSEAAFQRYRVERLRSDRYTVEWTVVCALSGKSTAVIRATVSPCRACEKHGDDSNSLRGQASLLLPAHLQLNGTPNL
jgi:hypothetical protein